MEANKISFHDHELPVEGSRHNKALHIAVKCSDKIVTLVLIDCYPGCNICLFTTLRYFTFNIGEIRGSHVNLQLLMEHQEVSLEISISHFKWG